MEKFVIEKNYIVESNIVDAIINELAKIALCIIKVHYQCGNGSFDHHAIVPSDSSLPDTPCIELAVINAEGRNVNLINFGVEQAAKESR